jgi:class 3 adenylate cyclase
VSFIETVERARQLLERSGRLSLRALALEFGLDGEQLEVLADELVEFQGVAGREGRALVWLGAAARSSAADTGTLVEGHDPGTAAAERRQLTVLFCDLVDSTRLAAGMDAEDWRELMRSYQEAASDVVARFDGHVAQYLGDGLLVYFGWPKAHEDDAERAVRAGLGIVDAIRDTCTERASELSVRVGIHTGPVVVGEMGGGERRETLALGDTTNLAARLQALAEPDTVVMSSATLRLVAGIFVTRDRGEHELRGREDRVRVHQAVQPSGVRSRLDVIAAAELTPFIGRDQELMLLEDRFAQVVEGSGHAVLVAGEAGIGKSRLVQAFRERIAERAHTWLECRGSPYTQDSAFYPILELHRQGLAFRSGDPAETKLDRMAAGLAAVGFDPAETVPVIAALHGVALGDRLHALNLSPEGLRKRTLALLTEWLLRLGHRQPLVLLVEDLPWMDPSTVELIGSVLEQVPTASVLLLAIYRPDFDPPWGARSFLTPMLLSRFTRAQLGDLVRKAARGRDLPDAWVEEILRRADGVPLFAEELTKAVLETHPEPHGGREAPSLHIPDTLQDSLMARLDALGPLKELAQLGSVLGREFNYDLLLKVSPLKESELSYALQVAVREELFYQRGVPPEATYLFKHALLRDVAYQSMLRATRQRHHRRVAETLIEHLPAVAEVQPELVAHHWTEAGEAEAAIAWWERGGDRANSQAAYTEGISHLRRGMALLPEVEPGERRDRCELELQASLCPALTAARGYGHAETLASYQRALTLVDRRADALRAARLEAGRANAMFAAGEPQEALEGYDRVLALAGEAGDLARITGHSGRANCLFFRGELGASRAEYDRALGVWDPERHDFLAAGWADDEGVSCLQWGAWCLWMLGFPDRAWRSVGRALQIVRLRNDPFRSFTTCWAAITALLRRDWVTAGELAQEARMLATQRGLPLFEAVGGLVESLAAGMSGGVGGSADRWFAQLGSTGSQAGAPLILGWWGEALFVGHRLEEAASAIDGALALAAGSGQLVYDAELHRLKGEVALARDATATHEAAALFRRSIEIARGQEAKSLELRAAISLARLWQQQGKVADARDLLAPIYAWFTEGFDTADLREAKELVDELAE